MLTFRIILVAAALVCTAAQALEKTPPVSLEVVAREDVLHLRLTNNSERRIGIFKGALPWATGLMGIRLYGFVGLSRPRELEQLFLLGHNLDVIEIRAAESIDGSVDLKGVFPDFSSHFKKELIMIFWRYKPVTEELKDMPVLHGLVVLSPDGVL
ncbi:hypothetical protein [Variovorax paradoxus]|uniref:hypothetical protein n=1 Tax=Variovorax paradoxus TaxID=34073 RepID=UPI003D65792F